MIFFKESKKIFIDTVDFICFKHLIKYVILNKKK